MGVRAAGHQPATSLVKRSETGCSGTSVFSEVSGELFDGCNTVVLLPR